MRHYASHQISNTRSGTVEIGCVPGVLWSARQNGTPLSRCEPGVLRQVLDGQKEGKLGLAEQLFGTHTHPSVQLRG